MRYILCADFGSTYTKLTAIDMQDLRTLGTSAAYTTVQTNILDGYANALDKLEKDIGRLDYDKRLAASSAAGGLKMIAVGLVPRLTSNAAKLAASSAGAKLIATYSYDLSDAELAEIFDYKPDMILLSGGIDGGNKDVILNNAEKIARIECSFPVVVAGNKSAADEVARILESGGKEAVITENVMPELNKLNIESAKAAIRELFIRRIIDAKGLAEANAMMSLEIIPTPLAVFNACEALSDFGTLTAVDVGGATTDVYSMADGLPENSAVIEKGLREPFAKRSIEGDLGVRYSIDSLIKEAGIERIAAASGASPEDVIEHSRKCAQDTSAVFPPGSTDAKIDNALAGECVRISMNRHAGRLETVYTNMGEVQIQTGKDLTKTKYLFGTGGSVINSDAPEDIMAKALYSKADYDILKPENPKIIIDRNNILTAMGLLTRVDKKSALSIMKKELMNKEDM
ncbi:MAG: methylaspartate mutase accessory protein GlmL [Oscillospiraceae bacterium]|nr:methylaspartate mutase accessory protein GlmL [Oscillospiraceae bacterium]